MTFSPAQTEQLLKPIRPSRVLRDGKGHSHVSQQDITAHLIRVFGFGSFDTEVVSVECVFETERADSNGVSTGRWDVCYRALLRLTVRDEHGREVCHFEDGSTATAQNQTTRGDGHDLAYKSALSLAKKRAAINLGDQFGLSLYNKGQTEALVIGTLVRPDGAAGAGDMQDGVPQQVSLGNDEVDPDVPEAQPRRPAKTSDLDVAEGERRSIPPGQARQERLEQERANRDLLGTKSDGRYQRGAQAPDREQPTAPADDLWTTGDPDAA